MSLSLSSGIAPVPLVGQRLRNPPPAPPRMGLDEARDLREIRRRNQAPLNNLRLKHASRYRT